MESDKWYRFELDIRPGIIQMCATILLLYYFYFDKLYRFATGHQAWDYSNVCNYTVIIFCSKSYL